MQAGRDYWPDTAPGKMRPAQRQTPSNTDYFVGEMDNYVLQQSAYINRDVPEHVV